MGPINRRNKIGLIGSGAIGSTMAMLSGLKELGDVVLFDVSKGMPSGKALDLSHTGPISDHTCTFVGADDYSELLDADVIIVTAGLTKAPGKSDGEWNRDDLLPFNAKIMRIVGAGIKEYCPGAFVICITNPLDCMVQVLQKAAGLSNNMICGMAGVLDSSRFRSFVAEALKVSPGDVQGFVIGAHGEAMLPLKRYCSVNGIPLSECARNGWITEEEIDAIVERTKMGGKEIVQLLGQGSAYYAPACAAIKMAEAYLRDQRKVLPCAVLLTGEYGVDGLYVGTPCVIGAGGIEKIIELKLNETEKAFFDKSVDSIRGLVTKLAEMEANL